MQGESNAFHVENLIASWSQTASPLALATTIRPPPVERHRQVGRLADSFECEMCRARIAAPHTRRQPMQFDRQLFLEDGYAILRNVIPPERLDKLRASFEVLVDRQQTIWARDPEDPSNHAYKVKQPRLAFQTGVDAATANTVELCLHANTLGVSRQALRDRDAAVSMMFLMCNPATDYGPDLWHRDHHHGPYSQAPLAGLQADMLANGGPGSVQWNIALYDDDVLWVVPGSHRRLNTPQENRELQDDPRGPLSNGMQVELQAGDGVMYINTNLHWPSNYTTKLRRCIHLGYRAFTGQLFPYAPGFYWNPGFIKHLSSEACAMFERFTELDERERDRIEALFRAMLDQDADRFREALALLHPGTTGRIVCVVLMSKLANRIATLKRPEIADLPERGRAAAVGEQPFSMGYFNHLARRFTTRDAELLRQRFAPLDARLKSEPQEPVSGFQGGPTRYRPEHMPADFDVDAFIASWSEAA